MLKKKENISAVAEVTVTARTGNRGRYFFCLVDKN